jgi:hypothetical protein
MEADIASPISSLSLTPLKQLKTLIFMKRAELWEGFGGGGDFLLYQQYILRDVVIM